jgi:hypothetical protein
VIAALPVRPFEFSPGAVSQADSILTQPPEVLYRQLIADQESEAIHLASLRLLTAFLSSPDLGLSEIGLSEIGLSEIGLSEVGLSEVGLSEVGLSEVGLSEVGLSEIGLSEIVGRVAGARDEIAEMVRSLSGGDAEIRDALLRQRAPIGLLGGCWLDVLSQPATQPSVIVNRLFAQHFTLRGEGNPRRSLAAGRRQALEQAGVYLPEIAAADFLAGTGARPLTAWHGCFYLALSRLPGNFLPELVGVHYAMFTLGLDDLLLGAPPMLAQAELDEVLGAYLELAGPAERGRLRAGIDCVLELEREHVAMLADLAAWRAGLPLESKVAAVIARHAPFAGRHHQDLKVGGRPLAETFTDPELDLAAFLAEFRESGHVRRTPDGWSRFTKAIKFGGPMFGIFSEREAATFAEWVATVQAGERPEISVVAQSAGDEQAAVRAAAVRASRPSGLVIREPGQPDDRELFYRLVNIENFANTRPLAHERAEALFGSAEVLFDCGAGGRYTDASYFAYSAQALYQRAEQVYWDKLVKPYQPLTEIPDRDEVVFLQTTYALGALVDATWIHRTANLGRCDRRGDAALFSIYADEMGYGDLRKNHITLIHRALASMDVRLPHIRDEAFMAQGDLPDPLYGFSLHQLCMALFPDTYYNEILGYNLAIEMFGLGELRLHEIQKLNHYGFDDCYEQAHLTIDNISAGHSRQAADIIVAYLDEVARVLGEFAVEREWRRVWRGYASLAYFVEHALLKQVGSGQLAAAEVGTAETTAAGEDNDSLSLLI